MRHSPPQFRKRWLHLGLALLLVELAACATTSSVYDAPADSPGVLLEDLTWQQAAPRLTAQTLVVLPVGAAAKEHGPHLLLKNDFLIAEYLKRRLLGRRDVVVAPTVNYNYYPAFVEYPGSTSLRLETARNLIVDICRSLARHGPRRFYALNTGVSTVRALALAQTMLAKEGILLHYTDLLKALSPIEKRVGQQTGGTHADESETSMMLHIAPRSVDMRKAVRDFHPSRPGPLTRNPEGPGTYSPTGTWGDPTLATPQKGEALTEGLVRVLFSDLTRLEKAELPVRADEAPPLPPATETPSATAPERTAPEGTSP